MKRVLLAASLLCTMVACKKDTETTAGTTTSTTSAIDCSATALSTVAFANTGTAQTTTLTVGLSNATAGAVTFNLVSSGSDFTPTTYTTTLTAGQTTVAIPLSFDGTSTLTSETITVSAASGYSGSCTAAATIGATASSCASATTPVAKVLCAIDAFKATLTTTQQAAVQFDYLQANAIKWSNLPCGAQCREGLQFSTLTTAQVAAAKAVVAAATGTVSDEGYSEAMQILAADDVLQATAGGSTYSSGNYFIAFVGTPSLTGTWQLQFGGHHLAVNTTYKNGVVAGATPVFEGVEPKTWTTNGVTYAPLASEQATMAAMLGSLTTAQLASAKLGQTFSDVVLGPNNDGKFPATKVGVAVSTLSTAQQALVLAAMKPWVTDTDDVTAATLLATYQSELANTYIAYSGNATLANNADYVRIDGPSVWIEFVCQSGVVYQNQIHYHSVWRDHTRDYGNSFTF
ncbi:MAG: DUF3500 domain-containing protein [Janthinobacterium lividum]